MRLLVLVGLILVLVHLPRREAMIYDKDIEVTGKYYLIDTFGFDENGTIEITFSGITYDGADPRANSSGTSGSTNSSSAGSSVGGSSGIVNPDPDYMMVVREFMAMEPSTEESTEEDSGNSSAVPITYFKMTMWICKDREYQSLIGSSPSNYVENKLCGDANAGNCPIKNVTIDNGKKYNFTITESDMYRVILLKCVDDRSVSMKVDYIFKNPKGQLSKGYLPLPTLYKYLSVISAVIFISTLVYWFKHRHLLNRVHLLLLFIVFLKVILMNLTLFYWLGADNSGKFNKVLKYFQNLFFSFTETAFFASLFILSRGLMITRTRLSVSETRTIFLILVFLLSVLLFFSFYNDVYYFLSLMILYFFMMPKIFTNITKNIRLLESHFIISRYLNQNNQISTLSPGQITLKKRVFRYLRTAIVLYLGAILFVNSMRIIMVWFLYWVSYSISEPISLLVIIFLLVLFKPTTRSPNIYQDANMNNNINITELSRSLEQLMNENLDPISLASIMETRSFDPTSCIIIEYPQNNYSLGVNDRKNQQDKKE